MRSKRITRVEFPARTFSPEQPPPTKRVAAYARVSTMKDAQENSLQAQQEYFTEYIQRHPGWVFAGMYSDDGISGLSIRKRDGFNSMVTDALDGKIDLILTIQSQGSGSLPGNQRTHTGAAAGERSHSLSPCGAAVAHCTLCAG